MSKLGRFARVIVWGAVAPLFVDSSTGQRKWLPVVKDAQWAVLRLTEDA